MQIEIKVLPPEKKLTKKTLKYSKSEKEKEIEIRVKPRKLLLKIYGLVSRKTKDHNANAESLKQIEKGKAAVI